MPPWAVTAAICAVPNWMVTSVALPAVSNQKSTSAPFWPPLPVQTDTGSPANVSEAPDAPGEIVGHVPTTAGIVGVVLPPLELPPPVELLPPPALDVPLPLELLLPPALELPPPLEPLFPLELLLWDPLVEPLPPLFDPEPLPELPLPEPAPELPLLAPALELEPPPPLEPPPKSPPPVPVPPAHATTNPSPISPITSRRCMAFSSTASPRRNAALAQ